jgi:hypothetical protein
MRYPAPRTPCRGGFCAPLRVDIKSLVHCPLPTPWSLERHGIGWWLLEHDMHCHGDFCRPYPRQKLHTYMYARLFRFPRRGRDGGRCDTSAEGWTMELIICMGRFGFQCRRTRNALFFFGSAAGFRALCWDLLKWLVSKSRWEKPSPQPGIPPEIEIQYLLLSFNPGIRKL